MASQEDSLGAGLLPSASAHSRFPKDLLIQHSNTAMSAAPISQERHSLSNSSLLSLKGQFTIKMNIQVYIFFRISVETPLVFEGQADSQSFILVLVQCKACVYCLKGFVGGLFLCLFLLKRKTDTNKPKESDHSCTFKLAKLLQYKFVSYNIYICILPAMAGFMVRSI